MIHVIATIECAEGRRDDYLAEFRNVAPKVRAEEGCIEYGPAVDAETNISAQMPMRPNVVTAIEKWESRVAEMVNRRIGAASRPLRFRATSPLP